MIGSRTALFAVIFVALASLAFAAGTGVNLTVTSACTSVNGNMTLSENVESNGTCFTIIANNVTFDCAGYTITGNNTGSGIFATGRTGLEVKNCIIRNFSKDIYTTDGSNNGWFHNNTLTDGGTVTFDGGGFYLQNSVGNNVTNNSVTNNYYNIYFGNISSSFIHLNYIADSTSNMEIHINSGGNGDSITNNTLSGNYINIVDANSSIIANNTLLGGTKIVMESSSGHLISHNSLQNSGENGIYLLSVNSSTVEYNTANSTSQDWIKLVSAYENTIDSNALASSAGGSGISLTNSNSNNVTNNNVSGATSYGIALSGSSHSRIVGDNVNGSGDGIHLASSNNNTIDSCNASFSSNDGFNAAGNNNTLTNSYVGNNTNNGIVSTGTGNVFAGNTVKGTATVHGIYVYTSSADTIANNTVNSSGTHGIFLENTNNSTVNNNTVANSVDTNIRLMDSDSNNITKNDVSNAGTNGLELEGSSNGNRIYNLTCVGCGSGYGMLVIDTSSGNYIMDVSLRSLWNFSDTGAYLSVSNNITNINVTGFNIGIEVQGAASNSMISNARVINSTTTCFYVDSAPNITLNNSMVSCPGISATGVRADSFSGGYSDGLAVTNSNISGRVIAISITNGDRVLIDRNNIYAIEGSATSLFFSTHGSFSNVTNNVVVCTTGAGCTGYGVLIRGDNNLLLNNSVYNFTDGTCQSEGIYLYNSQSRLYDNNVTGNYVENCSRGIYLDGMNSATATNNTISENTIIGIPECSSGSFSQGIGLDNEATGNFVTGNNVTNSAGGNTTGIWLDNGATTNVVSTNIVDTAAFGILVGWASTVTNNNVTGNNVSTITGSTRYPSVALEAYGTGNQLDGNSLTASTIGLELKSGPNSANLNTLSGNGYGIVFSDVDNTSGTNTIANSSIASSTNYDVLSNSSAQDILLNTTFNKAKVNFPMADDSNVTVEWYVRANVTSNAGAPISGASVKLKDKFGTTVQDDTTTAGLTPFVVFIEYITNATTNVSFNDHTANVTKAQDCGNRFNNTQATLTATTTWLILLDNTAPTVDAVYNKSAEDPLSCTNTSIGVVQFNVTDPNGACEINLSATYAGFAFGTRHSHSAVTCVNDSQTGNNSLTINCTGAQFYYWDPPGTWAVIASAQDNYGGNDTGSGNMTYNEAIYLTVNNEPINFGNVAKGTSDNINLNSPPTNLENCGNIRLNDTLTGANITDTTGAYWIPVNLFKANNQTDTSGAITLSEAAQTFQPSEGINVSNGATNYTWNTYYFVTIPTTQYATTYQNGTWTFTPSKT